MICVNNQISWYCCLNFPNFYLVPISISEHILPFRADPIFTLSREATLPSSAFFPFSTDLKSYRNEFFPLGANSFLLEKILFSNGQCCPGKHEVTKIVSYQ